ncbi:MAG: V4R domain-containing protein [Myxococcota bacterium]
MSTMVPLPEIDMSSQTHTLHNYYEPEKFLQTEASGRLVNRYRQRAMLVTEDFIVGFQVALEEEVGDAAGEIMYRCGYEWGKQDVVGFEQRFTQEFGVPPADMIFGMVLETWWWPLQVAGWGKWRYDLSHREEGLIFVDIWDSAVARSIGNVGHVVCHYYAGMFASVFGHFANRELSGIEIQCYSMGEDYCKFLIGSAKRINAAQFWVREGASTSEILTKL